MTKGLVALVQSKAAITNLIGLNPTRFFPNELPQGMSDFPAAAYRIVDIQPNATFDGGSKYDFAFVDIQCYGRTYGDAEELWKTMRRELVGSSGTYNTIQIDDVLYMPSGADDTLNELKLETKQLELRIDYIRQP